MASGRRVQVEGDMFHGRIPDGAKYVGRQMPRLPASPFNNPHTMPSKKTGKGCRACGELHERDELAYLYRVHLRDHPDLVERARRELVGWDLACWCKPGKDCHGDVLLAVIAGEQPLEEPPPIEPCRLCREQGRSFEGTGLPIFKRNLSGRLQDCLLCDGSGWPDYHLI